MEARPQRGRFLHFPTGAENIPPSKPEEALHQRHKSTSHLQSADAVSSGVLKMAAKRTVFGDVSNTSRLPMPNAATDARISNPLPRIPKNSVVPGKEHFNRPAQRPLSQRSAVPLQPTTTIQSVRLVGPTVPDSSAINHASVKPYAPKKAALVYRDQQRLGGSEIIDLLPAHHPSQAAFNPQLPRHHGSQPLLDYLSEPVPVHDPRPRLSDPLYAQQIALAGDDYTNVSYHDSVKGLTLDDFHHPLVQKLGQDSVYLDRTGQISAVGPNLIGEGRPKDISQPISEMEDNWYEDDDDDAPDDQAYTTAHSFRSRSDYTTMLVPRVDSQVQRELEDAKAWMSAHKLIDEWDEETWDVSMVVEYGDEILDYMRSLEVKLHPDPHYMDYQAEVDWSMRAVLVDWLVQVHMRFNLLPETLFLTVNYIDRFLTRKSILCNKLQLVGATALLIAAKYEEINCPSLEEIEFMVDKAYPIQEITKAERYMLSLLCFDLGWPGPMSFLRRVSKADEYDLETRTMAKYFLEVTLMDGIFIGCYPSFLAAGAYCLARFMLRKGDWSMAHIHYSGYTWTQLRPLVSAIIRCCQAPNSHHSAIFHKYCDAKFIMCAEKARRELEAGFSLPSLPSQMAASAKLSLGNYYRFDEMNLIQLPKLLGPIGR